MFKRMLLCASLSVLALFGSQLFAKDDLCTGKEIARVNWSFNIGVFGCPGPYGGCYGPAPWFGNPYYGGPCFMPYPGPYWYGCRPYPFWYY